MKNSFLFLITILIWGTTWIAIKFQLGSVSPEVSVAYRFTFASLGLLGFCLLRNKPLHFSSYQHLWIMFQGLCMFGIAYILVYYATGELTTGLVAIATSSLIGFNALLSRIFLKTPLSLNFFVGFIVGAMGLFLIFYQEITSAFRDGHVPAGLGYIFLATFFSSIGDVLWARNKLKGLPLIQVNGFAMLYGAIAIWGAALATGKPLALDFSFSYLAALFYLSLFGSIICFGAYLTLVGNVGPGRAAYVTIFYPIVALAISTVVEGFQWTSLAFAGVGLAFLGNYFMIRSS